MNLKHFLRGLGTGIIFTVLVLTIAQRSVKTYTSDEEVVERARELGMVNLPQTEPEEDKVNTIPETPGQANVEDQIQNNKNSDSEEQLSQMENPDSSDEVSDTPSMEEENNISESEEADTNKENTEEKESENTDSTKATASDEKKETDTKKDTETKKKNSGSKEVTVKVEVTEGMYSSQIAELLEKKGIIKDAKDFDKYLSDNEYSAKLRTGTYEIPVNASYEKIADLLVK